ncbi:MAG TPA: VOC family protein [Acidimicrobiia bacterium]|nr:VOC family protein [Acidimicrobiia bacterium]
MNDGVVHGLRQVAQRVEDLDRAVRFYEEVLGARLLARFDPPGFAFFDLGGVRLLLEGGAPPAMLYLQVDDVEAACVTLGARGVVFEGEPHAIFTDDGGLFGPPGGEEWMAFFRDSEGNLVGLSSRRG